MQITVSLQRLEPIRRWADTHTILLLTLVLSLISISCFVFFYNNQLGLAYNDARSHLNIGRRVVEGLKPGMAQLGSVWLPLPHLLMIPTIWNDFFWHSGLSGAMQSMLFFVITGVVIYQLLLHVGTDKKSAIFGTSIFVLNLNILYLQSTAMTELLLIGTMMLACYEVIRWHQEHSIYTLIRCAFWIMLSTLIRYDGWFLFFNAACLLVFHTVWTTQGSWKKKIQHAEGLFVLFCTLAGFGIFLWLVWNLVIFKDPLYFAFGPYSAHTQQQQLDEAGVLLTKKNLAISLYTYWHAMVFNSGVIPVFFAIAGAITLWWDKKISKSVRFATTILLASFAFNILALYLGHSVLFIQNLNGNTWFNVRYGIMLLPAIAVFAGYFFYRMRSLRPLILGLFLFSTVIQFATFDAVTVDDGRTGSSQKNVSQVSGWLRENVANQPGFVLISAASHDAIIFSSGLPMRRFIHEGTGTYWLNATSAPDRWARWIVMRTNDANDQTFKLVNESKQLYKYQLIKSYPFADIYQLRPEFAQDVHTQPLDIRQR